MIKGGRFVVRSFLKVNRDGVFTILCGHCGGLVTLHVGIIDAVVAHTFEPVNPNGLRTARLVMFLV